MWNVQLSLLHSALSHGRMNRNDEYQKLREQSGCHKWHYELYGGAKKYYKL